MAFKELVSHVAERMREMDTRMGRKVAPIAA